MFVIRQIFWTLDDNIFFLNKCKLTLTITSYPVVYYYGDTCNTALSRFPIFSPLTFILSPESCSH